MTTIRRLRRPLAELEIMPLFHGCTAKELASIDSLTYPAEVPPGTTLCRQGQFGRQVFIVISGQARVGIDGAEIAVLGPGSFFGEMSLLDGNRRVATVEALTPMRVLVLNTQDLNVLLTDVPSVARKMLAALSGRLRLADRALGMRTERVAADTVQGDGGAP
jgi:CRP-like cAMP-binding protein